MTEEEFRLNSREYALTKTHFKIGDVVEHQLAKPDRLEYTLIVEIYAQPYPDGIEISIYGQRCDKDGNIVTSSFWPGISNVNAVIDTSSPYNRVIKNVGMKNDNSKLV